MAMDVRTAAFNVAADFRPGGAAGLALALDMAPSTLSQECKGNAAAKLGLRTAVKMSAYTGDLRILHAFAAECGQMCVPLPDALLQDNDCMRALAAASLEFSQLVQEVTSSLGDDGRISDNELRRIDREGGQLIARINALMGAVQALNAAGKPAGA